MVFGTPNLQAHLFLDSVFLKLKIAHDKDLTSLLTTAYLPIVTFVIETIDLESRIPVLGNILDSMQDCIGLYTKLGIDKNKNSVKKEIFSSILKSTVGYTASLCKNIQKELANTAKRGDRILNQVFVSDLACELGACLSRYKKVKDTQEKELVEIELKQLLMEYNEVSGEEPISFEKLISKSNNHKLCTKKK